MGRYLETLLIYREGTEHLHRGEYLLAAQAFRQAIARFETNDVFHFHLGLAAALLGEWNTAESAFQRAVELNPESADALYGLALAFWTRGESQPAETHYRRALNLVQEKKAVLSPKLKRLAEAGGRIPEVLRHLKSAQDSLAA